MLLWQLADHRAAVHLARLQPDGQPPEIAGPIPRSDWE